MGLTRSLSTGASSLRAHQQNFDVISHNLANANTVGFKSNRATFQEEFNQVQKHGRSPEAGGTNSGGVNPLQFGLGVKLGSIEQDMSQGAIESTNRPLDMAMQGDGFFVFNLNGQELYSRAGNISMDKDGFLVEGASGAYLQGYNVETDANGVVVKDSNGVNNLEGIKGNLRIPPDVISAPQQTENVRITGNLDSANAEGYTKTTSISIFDGLGAPHDLRFTFTKTANPNEYTIAMQVDGNDVPLADNTLLFNSDGTLNTPTDITVTAADLNTILGQPLFDETTPKDISVNLANPSNITSGLRNYSGPNTATVADQDGYQSGSLLAIDVDTTGTVRGSFTNGQEEVLGRVLVGKFNNNEGLIREGGNFYRPSPNSGLANLGTAGDIFPATKVVGNALEMSNVDMTVEFTKMISTQRAFEAAARIITVSDQLLGETTILKR